MELALFCFFAFIAIVTSVGVIWARNPLHSALSLIAAFFALSAIYVLPFEVTSLLLLVAIVAAVVIAKAKI